MCFIFPDWHSDTVETEGETETECPSTRRADRDGVQTAALLIWNRWVGDSLSTCETKCDRQQGHCVSQSVCVCACVCVCVMWVTGKPSWQFRFLQTISTILTCGWGVVSRPSTAVEGYFLTYQGVKPPDARTFSIQVCGNKTMCLLWNVEAFLLWIERLKTEHFDVISGHLQP